MSVQHHDTLGLSGGIDYDPSYNKDFYVDGVSGDDTRDGLTIATCIKTIAQLYKLIPTNLWGGGKIRVHLAGTGGSTPFVTPTTRQTYDIDQLYVGGGAAVVNPVVFRGPQMIRATLAAGPSTAALDNPACVDRVDETNAHNAAGLRSKLLFTAAVPNWNAHEMGPPTGGAGIGKSLFIRVSRGANERYAEIPIADNGKDWIIVDCIDPSTDPILPTDTVEIVQPSVLIEGQTIYGGGARILDIRGYGSVIPSLAALVTADQGCTFERIAFYDTFCEASGISLDRCQMLAGAFAQCVFTGQTLIVNCAGDNVDFNGANAGNGHVVVYPWSRPDSATSPGLPQTGVEGAFRSLDISNGAYYLALQSLGCYFSSSSGIRVRGRASIFEQDGTNPYVGGKNSTAYGINADNGGTAKIRGGINTTITGTTNNLVCEGTAVAYGVGAGQFQQAGAGNYNGNVHKTTIDAAGSPQGRFSQITV